MGTSLSRGNVLLAMCAIFFIGGMFLYTNYHVLSPTEDHIAETESSFSENYERLISSDGSIEWQVLFGAVPVREVMSTSTAYGPAPRMAIYHIGTYLSGPYIGKYLYFGNGENRITYGYFIGDESGEPLAWWGYDGWRRGPYGDIETLGLQNIALAPKNVFPQELRLNDAPKLLIDSNGNLFQWHSTFIPLQPHNYPSGLQPVTPSTSLMGGNTLMRYSTEGRDDGLRKHFVFYGYFSSSPTYYIKSPIGILYGVNLVPDFFDEALFVNVPKISWIEGSIAVAEYGGGELYKEECYTDFEDISELETLFKQTGISQKGSLFYEVDPTQNENIYKCLYKHVDNSKPGAPSYDAFLQMHPVFFWEDPYGYWYNFIQIDLFRSEPIDGNV